MKEIIDVEVVEQLPVIKVVTKPVIEYSKIAEIGESVKAKIESLNIDTLEATEDNLSLVKNTRANLNKDFKELEEQRKLVKDIVMADYNIFEDEYKKLIAEPFKNADISLKKLVDGVDNKILQNRINKFEGHFVQVNKFDFIEFKDFLSSFGENIIKSKTDKYYECKIGEFLTKIENDLATIDTLINKERVLAKYQLTKDLNSSVSQVNIEIQREELIKEQAKTREEAQKQPEPKKEEVKPQEEPIAETKAEIVEEKEQQIFKSTFVVVGTREQITAVRNFMREKGIKYE